MASRGQFSRARDRTEEVVGLGHGPDVDGAHCKAFTTRIEEGEDEEDEEALR